MSSVFKQKWRVALAAVALGSIGISGTAFAQVTGTQSGTSVSNTATVNYTVASVSQTPITASAAFTVDTVIQFTVDTTTAANVTPGQTGLIASFTVDSASNIASDFQLDLLPVGSPDDDFDMSNIVIRVDDGDGVYETSDPVANTITGLESVGRVVWVTSDVPLARVDGDTSNIRIRATAINPSTSAAWVNDGGVDVVGGLAQIVVANATAADDAIYTVQTANLAVTKSSTVITDNLVPPSANPKAIPGATVEYAIAIQNTGSQSATVNSISDPVPAATAFAAGQYPGTRDVSIQVNANPATYCIAESGGDTNVDGCFRTGATLTVGAPAITSVAAGATVTVRFRVNIQ
jgi:uncharacterized repeat protein (TIGR01451 family)